MVLLGFNPSFSLIFLNPDGNRGQGKKENKVLDKEVNLTEKLGFRVLGFTHTDWTIQKYLNTCFLPILLNCYQSLDII